jgi:propanol-preferring alcohol dehydrogenase
MAAVEIPSRHKALVYDNPGSISTKIEEVETPKPGAGELLVNLTHSGGKLSLPSAFTHGGKKEH